MSGRHDTILPVRRRLFSFCSALSLLLFVTTCIFWARSYYWMTGLVLRRLPDTTGERLWGVISAGGGLHLSTMRYTGWPYPAPPQKRFTDARLKGLRGDLFGAPDARFAGFTYQRERPFGYNPGQPKSWRIPFWFIAVLAGAPFTFRTFLTFAARRRLLAKQSSICSNCGYDSAPRPAAAQSAGRMFHQRRLHETPWPKPALPRRRPPPPAPSSPSSP